MSATEWISKSAETLGITLAFAFFGSSMLLWISADKQPLSVNRASMIIMAGQMVGSATGVFAFGYFGWPWFVSPAVGFVAGIAAIPVIRAIMKIAQRGEDRSGDLADGALDRVVGRQQDRLDRSLARQELRNDVSAGKAEQRLDKAADNQEARDDHAAEKKAGT